MAIFGLWKSGDINYIDRLVSARSNSQFIEWLKARNPEIENQVRESMKSTDSITAWTDAIGETVISSLAEASGIGEGNIARLLNTPGEDYDDVSQLLIDDKSSEDVVSGLIETAKSTSDGKNTIQIIGKEQFTAKWEEKFGSTTGANEAWEKNDTGKNLTGNPYESWNGSFGTTVDAYEGIIKGDLTDTYRSAYFEATGELPTTEQENAFLDSFENNEDMLVAATSPDDKTSRDALSRVSTTIKTTLTGETPDGEVDPVYKPTPDQIKKKADSVGLTYDEAVDQVNKKVDDFQTAAGEILNTEATAAGDALAKYEAEIPDKVSRLRETLESDEGRRLAKLPEQFGEAFGGQTRQGAFWGALAEDTAEGSENIKSFLSQYQLGQEDYIAGQRLDWEGRLASEKAQIGLGAEQMRTANLTGLTQAEANAALNYNYQTAMAQFNAGIQNYLDRYGFSRQIEAMGIQQANNLQSLGVQQGFQAQQNAVNRAHQLRLAKMEVDANKRQSGNRFAGGLQGALSGAYLGAQTGSVIPGIGTLYGGIVGGLAGGLSGYYTNRY